MKEILSYYDIPLILLVIYIAILRWKKQNEYYKECKREIEINESKGIFDNSKSNSIRLSDKYTKSTLLLIIGCGVLGVYNRLNGNMPNVFLIIKSLIIHKFQNIQNYF